MANANFDYPSLVLRSFDNALSGSEKDALDQWLLIGNHTAQYRKLQTLWNSSGQLSYPEIEAELNVDEAFNKVMKRTQFANSGQEKRISYKPLMLASCLFLLVGILGYLTLRTNTQENYETIYAEANMEYTLPDNSKVWLSKGSNLSYQKDFASNRNITMNGKVMYEVTHNPNNPFVIDAEGMEITVLGTKFIISNTGASADYVDVINGKVKVADKQGQSENLILTKGMSAQINKGQLQLVDNSAANEMFWASGSLRYNNSSLETIFADLEKYYDINIVTNNQFSNCKFKGAFYDEELKDVLATLKVIYDLEIQNVAHGITIDGAPCKELQNN